MTIIVTFAWTTADLLRAAYVGLRSRRLVFVLSVGFFIVVPWAAALSGMVAYAFGAPIRPFPIVGLIAIPPVAVGAFALMILFQVRGARSLQGSHTYEFSQADIRLKGPGFDNRVEWGILTRCHGSAHGLLFMSGNAPLISVPGCSLSPASRAELRQLVAAKGLKLTGRWKVEAEHVAPPDAQKDARG